MFNKLKLKIVYQMEQISMRANS